ncbi:MULTISPECIES: Na+/H+ antiporter subunit E [unclassified Luteimonas]|uniref:Na+/H+ antiporter subunit E n=1 Tax=unclassified Luteimonas TaxID=2629088 RepID=UPI0015FF7F03|nr:MULTISPECIES: Na+/H+ antiporter subunit E [unclassified Luteimonas]MBB1473628.1 Na+/H+ antiporter subunit E [Luteimonas sp. MC1782]MBB6600157.1 Na+/H+ antiporter subunit E [Luteimonas sp. MC1825]QOC87849.1 Na+/H+ antiporter subunit E [Luteimonas sp. MC1825]
MNRRRWLPSMPLSLGIVAFWMLMVSEFDLAQFVLALLLGLVVPLFATRLDREFARIGSVRPLPRLMAVLLWDIVLSNLRVARQVLGAERNIHPGFIWYPLELDNIHGITALACCITMTPGTVTAALSDDRRYLLVHVLDLDDEAQVVADIKRRYECPLMEIFP